MGATEHGPEHGLGGGAIGSAPKGALRGVPATPGRGSAPPAPQPPTLVLGMPPSGTSSLAGSLQAVGLALGERSFHQAHDGGATTPSRPPAPIRDRIDATRGEPLAARDARPIRLGLPARDAPNLHRRGHAVSLPPSTPAVYLPPSLRGFRPLHAPPSTWTHHQPFGYDLVAALRPRLLVELGTQGGLSYFTFCQSMREQGVDGLAYAVDTWEGDEHTRAYDDEVYRTVERRNRQYQGFSYLMRMLFRDALGHFSDGTVDLLHVDGLHTYEAVSEDFRLWGPKVRPGGIVLFHDIRARLMDFGAWRFWDEVEREHETFAFNHGFGLGVLRMPGGDRSSDAGLLRLLFEGSKGDGGEALRAFYVHAARFHELARQAERAEARKAERAAHEAGRAPSLAAPPTRG